MPLVFLGCCVAMAADQGRPTSRPSTFTIHPKGPAQADHATEGQPATHPPVIPKPIQAESGPDTSRRQNAKTPGAVSLSSNGASGDDRPIVSVGNKTAQIPTPAAFYGLWAMAPALVAIIIAILTRQVLIALPLGIFAAAGMMKSLQGVYNPIEWLTYAVDHYLFGILATPVPGEVAVDYGNLKILTFTLLIGAMVGVIEVNGGTRAMVARVTRHLRTRSRGQLGALLAGILVFFDDYANAMIVGPSMRPVFDRLRLSREKLAYIVDSTAAPVASLFIGTWLVTEISYIDKGLDALGSARPSFLATMTGSTAFWYSLPYRTYAWLALAMVFFIGITGRDFGAMRKAEARAGDRASENLKDSEPASSDGRRWPLAVLPVAMLVLMTVGLLVASGWSSYTAGGGIVAFDSWDQIGGSLSGIMGDADSYTALLYASICSAVLAIVITLISRAQTLGKTMDGVVAGMSRMFAACIVLVLAWGLSQGGKDLQLGMVASDFLKRLEAGGLFSSSFLPLATFITAAIVSFATGTSWGTMGILCPAVVAIAARLFADMPEDHALALFYSTVGAVLTGAVFGDHCSPISDTTVLSSIASECELGAHVWTQMPYALVVAFVCIASTDFLHYGLDRWAHDFFIQYEGWVVYIGTSAGAVLLFLIVLVFGRRPNIPVLQKADSSREA